MQALIKCMNNLVIQNFRSLANWIFHGVYDFISGVMRLGLEKLKRRVEIWMSEE